MKFYCGIDLGARNSQVCTIDDDLNIQLQQKVPNDLPRIIHKIEPFKENLQIVVDGSSMNFRKKNTTSHSFTLAVSK